MCAQVERRSLTVRGLHQDSKRGFGMRPQASGKTANQEKKKRSFHGDSGEARVDGRMRHPRLPIPHCQSHPPNANKRIKKLPPTKTHFARVKAGAKKAATGVWAG